jgi:hypothetical protein
MFAYRSEMTWCGNNFCGGVDAVRETARAMVTANMGPFEPPPVPATPGRKGGQRLILATPNPNQSRVSIGWMGANNELWYGGQIGSWFLRMSKRFSLD